MTTRTTHTLTALEISCGVTLEQVAEVLPKVLLHQDTAILPADLAPALATSVARCALGVPFEYVGHNMLSLPVYRRLDERA